MQRTDKSPKIWVWVGGIALIVFLIIGGVGWYVSLHWRTIVDARLKRLILEATDSLYTIQYSRLNINPLSGNAAFEDFRLKPDPVIYRKLEREQKAPDNLYNVAIQNIKIENFHPKLIYYERKLNIESISLSNPTLLITMTKHAYNNTRTSTDSGSLHKVISKGLREIRINKIKGEDMNVTLLNKNRKENTTFRNMDMIVTDWLLDSLSGKDKMRIYNSRDIQLFLDMHRIATADSLYYLTLKKLSVSTANRNLKVNKIDLKPRYSVRQFYKKTGFARYRYSVEGEQVSMRRIDIDRFIKDQKLYVGAVDVGKAGLSIYYNNAYPPPRNNKRGMFPHEHIQEVSGDFRIDTLNLERTDISFELADKNSGQTGKITFQRTRGRIFNITNDPASLRGNSVMRADLTSFVMNSGKLGVHFVADLTDKSGTFTYRGILGPMDGRVFNSATGPMGMIIVNSALIKKLQFDVRVDRKLATGKVHFFYNDLNIRILKRNPASGGLKQRGFVSKMANMFVIKGNNPNAKGKLKIGNINYKKNISGSYANFIWQSLFSGIKESVGVDQAREDRIRNANTRMGNTTNDIGDLFENIKLKRSGGKIRRQEKREDRRKNNE